MCFFPSMLNQKTASDSGERDDLARIAADERKLSLAIQKVRHQARLISDAVRAGEHRW